ncbi:unnamed protein product [Lota lota]
MVSVRSSELGPMAWDAVTKRQLFLQKVSSKLGPGARHQAGRRAPGASSTTGPGALWGSGAPGQGGGGPRPAQAESSSLGKEAASGGGGAPARARLSHNQGILKPRPTSERSSSLATQYSVTANSKAASPNQLAGSLPCGRSVTATPPSTGSKLPVKGLPRSLSASSLGSSPAQNNGEAPGRGAPPVGSQSSANPLCPSGAVSTDANSNANNNASTNASTRAPGTRCRALSIQNRTTTTGLKPPAVTGPSPARPTNHAAAGHKTAASANQAPAAKVSQNPLQRSGSARFNRPTSTISPGDNMLWSPRLALSNFHVRLTAKGLFRNLQLLSGCRKNTVVFHAAGPNPNPNHNLNHSLTQQPPAEIQGPDLLNGNGPPPRHPAQTPEGRPRTSTSTPTSTSSPTSPSTPQGMGVRSGPRPRGRAPPLLAAGPSSGPQPGGGGSRVEEKRSYSKEQVEENRLRRLLVQGNRRVEALATVIHHLLSELLHAELEQLQKEKEVLSSQQEVLCSVESSIRMSWPTGGQQPGLGCSSYLSSSWASSSFIALHAALRTPARLARQHLLLLLLALLHISA